MITLRGKGASRGIAIGRARLLQRQGSIPSPKKSTDVMEELGRYERARAATIEELQQLYERLLGEIGEEQASIFSVQAMMAEDEDIDEAIRREIMEGGNAEHAVTLAKDEYSAVFEGMEDEYMRARAEDVRQVSRRILEQLHGVEANSLVTNEAEGQIVCAEDLSPAETVGLDRRLVSGIVTARGSINSHTAILARTLGIPALVWIYIVVAVVFAIVLSKTLFGRNVYAVGSNAAVAQLSGISVNFVKIACFAISGFMALIIGWYQEGFRKSSEEMARIAYRMLYYPILTRT